MSDESSFGPEADVDSIEGSRDSQRDRDGVGSLRDTEAESGDEEELDDLFDLDERAAREVGGEFDGGTGDEPALD
jgi:hypothetical protein